MCCWVSIGHGLIDAGKNFYLFLFRQSASCTHVSALLHALSALNTSTFQPGDCGPTSDDEDEAAVPCTSQPCRWKQPKKRKESNLRLSDASFEKHDYAKPVKRKIRSVEDFDPRPESFQNVRSRLPDLLQKVKGEQLCISLLFDPQFQYEPSHQPSDQSVPDVSQLKEAITAFKRTLELTADKSREIERDTREQRNSPLWFAVRSHRITASFFGSILTRKCDTSPDSLVLRIIQPRNISTPAIIYGIEKEKSAIEDYVTSQHNLGHRDLVVAPSGVIINPSWSFLGASPDGAVYDPSNFQQPYGFIEVKCPYSVRNVTLTEACSHSGFCSRLNSVGQLELKETHQYYAQVQGQMAIGERIWCDFVVFTLKGISIQRIYFNQDYWNTKLLPKLISFYDNCVAPELVSPIHPLGLPLRDLSKI